MIHDHDQPTYALQSGGTNRVSASMMKGLADTLDVSPLYFFSEYDETFTWEYALVAAWRGLPPSKRLMATNFVKALSEGRGAEAHG